MDKSGQFEYGRRTLDLFLGDSQVPRGCCARDLDSRTENPEIPQGPVIKYVTINFATRTLTETTVPRNY